MRAGPLRLTPVIHRSLMPLAWRTAFTLTSSRQGRESTVVVGGSNDASAKVTAPSSDTASFTQLNLSQELLEALHEKGLTSPTEIQSTAIPALLLDRRSDFSVASHTGSGKTLAYLLPVVQVLKEQECVYGVPTKPRRPRALILGPTRELAEQIHAVAKSISHSAKFRTALATGAGDMGTQRAALDKPLDIVVGTPMRVAQHAQRGNVFYGDVEVVILDEADTMLDRGFGPEVEEILKAVRGKSAPARCILVSATMTKAVRRLVTENFPSIRAIETTSLHKGVQGARHTFLPASAGSNKLDILTQVVEGELAREHRILVFCNTLDSCRAAEHHLREVGLPTLCYHGDVPMDARKDAIRTFASSETLPPPVLVATDLAARGLDIPGRVDHVINFDFPMNPVDYLHRTGRTARAGASGRITSLVGKSDRVLAQRIEDCLERGLPLDQLSASKISLPPHMRPKTETLARRAAERKAEQHSTRGGRGRSSSTASNSSSGGLKTLDRSKRISVPGSKGIFRGERPNRTSPTSKAGQKKFTKFK